MKSRFQRWVCEQKTLWVVLLAFTSVHLILALLAMGGVQKGTASYFVLGIDFILIGFLLAVLALVFWRCGYLTNEVSEY